MPLGRHSASCPDNPVHEDQIGPFVFLPAKCVYAVDATASPPPPPWPAMGICLDYMHVSSCVLGKASLISLGDSYGKCPARLPVKNVPIRSCPSVNLWIRLTWCEMLAQTAV